MTVPCPEFRTGGLSVNLAAPSVPGARASVTTSVFENEAGRTL